MKARATSARNNGLAKKKLTRDLIVAVESLCSDGARAEAARAIAASIAHIWEIPAQCREMVVDGKCFKPLDSFHAADLQARKYADDRKKEELTSTRGKELAAVATRIASASAVKCDDLFRAAIYAATAQGCIALGDDLDIESERNILLGLQRAFIAKHIKMIENTKQN